MNAAGRLNSHLLADRGLFDTANFLIASDILRAVCTKARVRIKVLDLGHILEAQPEPEEHSRPQTRVGVRWPEALWSRRWA
jgi:hypothetical protein